MREIIDESQSRRDDHNSFNDVSLSQRERRCLVDLLRQGGSLRLVRGVGYISTGGKRKHALGDVHRLLARGLLVEVNSDDRDVDRGMDGDSCKNGDGSSSEVRLVGWIEQLSKKTFAGVAQ